MKIKAVRSKLLGGIKAVQDVVKATDEENPLRNIRVESVGNEAVLLTGSNGNVQIQSRVFCEVTGDVAMTVVGSRLAAFVGSLDEGPVEIDEGTPSRARISGIGAEFSLAKGDVADFPIMKGPDPDASVVYSIPALKLRVMLDDVRYVASKDKTRKMLQGVLVSTVAALPGIDSKIEMTATDGRRLSSVSAEIGKTKDSEVILPSETVNVLVKLLGTWGEGDVSVSCDKRAIRFTAELWSVTSLLVEGAYPNWRQVVPKDELVQKTAVAQREWFLKNLARAKLSTWKDSCNVKLTFSEGTLTFDSRNEIARTKAVMEVDYKGPKTSLVFNPDLLKDVLDCIDTDDARFSFADGKTPAVIRFEDLPFLGVVMPLRDEEVKQAGPEA